MGHFKTLTQSPDQGTNIRLSGGAEGTAHPIFPFQNGGRACEALLRQQRGSYGTVCRPAAALHSFDHGAVRVMGMLPQPRCHVASNTKRIDRGPLIKTQHLGRGGRCTENAANTYPIEAVNATLGRSRHSEAHFVAAGNGQNEIFTTAAGVLSQSHGGRHCRCPVVDVQIVTPIVHLNAMSGRTVRERGGRRGSSGV